MPNGETITLSADEARLFISTLDSIVEFAQTYPLEFQAFCDPVKFEAVLKTLARAEQRIRTDLAANAKFVRIEAAAMSAILDIEECLSAAKSARVDNSRTALFTSIGGGIIAGFLDLPMVATVATVAAVGILILGPSQKAGEAPEATTEPAGGVSLGAPSRDAFLERVILPGREYQVEHHWGRVVDSGQGLREAAICLESPKYLIRVEGFEGLYIEPRDPWREVPLSRCDDATKIAAVWTERHRISTAWGSVPDAPKKAFWVAYKGPMTGSLWRFAGPFG